MASQEGHKDALRHLLERETEVNTAKQAGSIALILASQNGHCEVVNLLLQRKVEVNTVTNPGNTALILASQNGHSDVVRLLLERGAEVNTALPSGSTALILASQNGHCDIVRLLLVEKAEVNAVTKAGSTALILASQDGHCGVVKLLLGQEAEVNRATLDGSTALILASQDGHCDVVRHLLDWGAEVNTVTHAGTNALILASQDGHCDVVRLLLEREAEVNTVTKAGNTAVILASQNGHCDVVRLLLEREAEVHTVTQAGNTAVILASQNGHCDVVRLLLEREADVNGFIQSCSTALILASQEGHSDIVRQLLERKIEVNTVAQNGATALMATCQNDHCDVVRQLLDREAGVNTVTQAGSTALMLASQRGHYDVVKLLLEQEAEVNRATPDGSTALILASQNGHFGVVKLLLEREAEVNRPTPDGSTALILASQNGHCDIVKVLLEREAEVNMVAQKGTTALMVASQKGHYNVVRLLLEGVAEVNTATPFGSTALILASQNGYCGIVRLLLERKAKVNAVTQDGSTALILASQKGFANVVRLLLERETDINTVTQAGSTALILASQNGHCDIVRLLLAREAAINTVTKAGSTAFILASQNGHHDVVRLLWERDGKVNTVTQAGNTAFILASQNGHSDVVRLLLEREAEVNTVTKVGSTALIQASQNGHRDTVRLLLEREVEVNTVTQDGSTALILASQNGHSDVVRLLLERDAQVNTITLDGNTALILASQAGHWSIAKLLIDAGANVSHVNKYGEIAAMYIVFADAAKKCDTRLEEIVKYIWENPTFAKSHYAMFVASVALLGALLYKHNNIPSDWFTYYVAKSDDVMYAFLPASFHRYGKSDEHLFSDGLEGKIGLHTLGTAAICKLPHTALQCLTTLHRDKLVNMLGQNPLHLLALENYNFDDMEEKILLTETVGFSFSDKDNNGRVPYHIACMCLNAHFLLCGLKLDLDFRSNILVQDHLGETPLAYMANLLYNTTESSDVHALKVQSAKQTLQILIQSNCPDLAMDTQLDACTDPRPSNDGMRGLMKYFKSNMTVTELTDITNKVKKMVFDTDDVVSLFKCSTSGIVNLSVRQHAVVSIIHLLEHIGIEMGKIDSLFKCVPGLKGSVLEYTKSGELDELDTSMKLVNFTDYFSMHIIEDGIEIFAKINAPGCNRYWISGERDMFSSIEFCADFWQIFLKVLDTEVIRTCMKSNRLMIENCKRKHGFVGMLNICCHMGTKVQFVSVDIAPSIVDDDLNEYTALLRPRHYDNKAVGREFFQGLELSSSEKDWNFLKFLQPEVICAYALVKMLRSLADTFQTEQGKVYTATDILPSYMMKTALLWILDPEEKCSKVYKHLKINSVFHNEHISSYKDDVHGLCKDLLWHKPSSIMGSRNLEKMMGICKKCTTGTGNLTVRERILPYVLATRRFDRQEQNGLNLPWIRENWKPDIEDISYQDEIVYSRKFYTDPEEESEWTEHCNNNQPVRKLSHHSITYPDINEETASKCRVWALRMLRILPHLLQYDRRTSQLKEKITGVRNYYLPDQEIYARDKDLAIALCRVLEAILE